MNDYSYVSRSAERLPFVEHLPQGVWTMPDEQDTERFQGLYKRIPLQARPKNGQTQPLSYIDKTLSMGVQTDSSSLNHKLQNMREKFFKSLTKNYKPARSQSREGFSNGNLHSTNREHSSYNQVDSVVVHHEPNVSPIMMKRANFQEQNYQQFYGKFDTNPDSQLHKNRLSEDFPRFQNASMFVSRESEDSMLQNRRSQGRHPYHPKSEVENIYRHQEMQRSKSSNFHERDLQMINERPHPAAAYLPTSMSFRANTQNTQNTQSAASVGSRALLTENEPPRELEIIPEKSQKMFVMVDNGMSKQSSPLSQGQKLYTSFLKGKLSAMNVGQTAADPFNRKKSLRNFLHENKNFNSNVFASNEITSNRHKKIKSPPRSPQIYNQHKKKNSKREQIIENYESNDQDDDGWIPLNSFPQGKRQQTLENSSTDPEKTLPSTRRGTVHGNPDGSGLHMLSQITDRLDPVEQDYMKQAGCLNMMFSLQKTMMKRLNHGFQSIKKAKSGKGKSSMKVSFDDKTKVKIQSLLKDEKILVKFSVLSDMNSAIKQAMMRIKTQAFYQLKFSTQTFSSGASDKVASLLMILQISQARERNSKRRTFDSWRLTNTIRKNKEIEQLRTKKLVQAFSVEKDKLVLEIKRLRDKIKYHESNSSSQGGSQNFLKSMPSLTELIHGNSNPNAKIPPNNDQTIRHFTIHPINKWPTPTSVMEHDSAAETQACSQPGLDSTSNKFTSREIHQQGKQVPAPKRLDPIGEFIRRNPKAQSQVDENGYSPSKGKAYGPPAMVQMERILRESILKFATDNNNTTSLGDINKEFVKKNTQNSKPSAAAIGYHMESLFGSRKDSIESMVNCSYLKSPDLSEIMREKPNGGGAGKAEEESFGDIDDNSLVASERGLSYRKDTMN